VPTLSLTAKAHSASNTFPDPRPSLFRCLGLRISLETDVAQYLTQDG
jgi:hypothetical protein